ncbi:dolichyl-diphosphooligosaccharide--protein glycosyltransferase subunit STT3B-like isoform X2 [Clavelina lepadiformis]|uniref:dolichyl-diphosphooligosaccharide--protein glycosyltransferase subunit STT3B-like isoform X2 n=1 Tax=Clavelina lepadiformis TaxID=159417 RepID=UPI004042D428
MTTVAHKGLGSLSSPGAQKSLIAVIVLTLCCIIAFSSRLFAVIRFESIIHEFDPWFNYRATHRLSTYGFYDFLNWFDERAWYPLGRIVGGTIYPGLMVTAGLLHWILNSLHITVHIRDVCVFLAPVFSGFTSIATFFLTREIWDSGAALFAACFISIVPGYISRSVAGSYDNEGVAIFALQLTYFFWIRALKKGSIFWSVCTALSYFYMVSAWGGYVFIINLIPLHVFVLLIMQRYSARVYVAYTTFFILGLLLSMQIPFVGFQPIRTSEHMASAGVFGLLQAYCFLDYIRSKTTKQQFRSLFVFLLFLVCFILFVGVVFLTYAGYIAPWSGRFYSLWDTGYAKIHIPIIASVSEHQPTTWSSFFFDLHVLSCAFPAGLWFCVQKINDERVFVILYAVFASYFAGVMVRLMLTLTPIVCVLAGIAFSNTLSKFIKDDANETIKKKKIKDSNEYTAPGETDSEEESSQEPGKSLYDKAGKSHSKRKSFQSGTPGSSYKKNKQDVGPLGANVKGFVLMAFLLMLLLFVVHCTWVTSNAYSSPSVVLASYNNDGSRVILDDFREAYHWLRQNTHDRARVMSWWDYGYQIAGMANRTTLVDNNTWNNSHIALVGKAMASTEEKSIEIMRMLDVDYVLIIFGGMIGYSGDDINKFLWMVRIAEGEHPQDIKESKYFTPNGEFRVDKDGSPTLLNCLMYKMSYYRFGELQMDFRSPPGFDRTRNVEIGNKNIKFEHLEEAFTSEHWLVRIYKVLKPANRQPLGHALASKRYKAKHISRKTNKRKKGFVKNKLDVKKGRRTRPASNMSTKKSRSKKIK